MSPSKLDTSNVFDLAIKHAKQVRNKYKEIKPLELAKYLTAVIKVESNFNPYAQNKNSTARGLSQILICTQRELEYKHIKEDFAPAMFNCKAIPQATVNAKLDKMFDADYAVMLAAYYLGYQYNRYVDWFKAIAAYNQGSYTEKNKLEGKNYANKVMEALKDLDLNFYNININNYLFRRREFY